MRVMPPESSEPQQRSLRGVIRGKYEEEGDRIIDALLADLDSTGLTDDEIAERSDIDKAQLSRIRARKAHVPGKLLSWAIDQSRHRPPRFLVACCAAGDHEPKPLPPPEPAAFLAAYQAELAEMGLEDLLRQRVARRLHGSTT